MSIFFTASPHIIKLFFNYTKNVCFAIFLLLILRKIYVGHVALRTVNGCLKEFDLKNMFTEDSIIKSNNYQNNPLVKDHKKPLLVFILNKYALNMTFNFLCNTKFIQNVHGQLLVITLDLEAKEKLVEKYPDIHVLFINIPCLHNPFNYGDGSYQALYVLRAKLSLELLNHGYSFFMAQQDTFWRDSLLDIEIPPTADIVFDSASSKVNLIAGGHYFTHPTERSKRFFSVLADDLSKFYAPDNAYMTLLCYRNVAKCDFIKFNLITNWIWIFDEKLREEFKNPMLIQFDGHTNLGGKLDFMKKLGFYFVNPTNMNCDEERVEKKMKELLEFNDKDELLNIDEKITQLEFPTWNNEEKKGCRNVVKSIHINIYVPFFENIFSKWDDSMVKTDVNVLYESIPKKDNLFEYTRSISLSIFPTKERKLDEEINKPYLVKSKRNENIVKVKEPQVEFQSNELINFEKGHISNCTFNYLNYFSPQLFNFTSYTSSFYSFVKFSPSSCKNFLQSLSDKKKQNCFIAECQEDKKTWGNCTILRSPHVFVITLVPENSEINCKILTGLELTNVNIGELKKSYIFESLPTVNLELSNSFMSPFGCVKEGE